jgi:hypothetical protein
MRDGVFQSGLDASECLTHRKEKNTPLEYFVKERTRRLNPAPLERNGRFTPWLARKVPDWIPVEQGVGYQ